MIVAIDNAINGLQAEKKRLASVTNKTGLEAHERHFLELL